MFRALFLLHKINSLDCKRTVTCDARLFSIWMHVNRYLCFCCSCCVIAFLSSQLFYSEGFLLTASLQHQCFSLLQGICPYIDFCLKQLLFLLSFLSSLSSAISQSPGSGTVTTFLAFFTRSFASSVCRESCFFPQPASSFTRYLSFCALPVPWKPLPPLQFPLFLSPAPSRIKMELISHVKCFITLYQVA